MEEFDKYLEAARLIAECKPSKLPYVLAMLKQGGFNVDDAESIAAEMKKKSKSKRAEYDRKTKNKCVWQETSDKLLLALRNAYEHGQNMTEFASTVHLSRASLYKIMAADQKGKPSTRKDIENGLIKFGWIDPAQ